jgi:hypothetical protein
MTRASGARDARFQSAAIFAPDGMTLKKLVQPKLKALGWKSPGGWRGSEFRCMYFADPPKDYTPWQSPGGVLGPMSIRLESIVPAECDALIPAALDFIGEQPPGLKYNTLSVDGLLGGVTTIRTGDDGDRSMSITFFDTCESVLLPSPGVLEPWAGYSKCRFGPNPSDQTNEMSSWTVDELRKHLSQWPRYSMDVSGVSDSQFRVACEALKAELTGNARNACHAVGVHHTLCDEVFPLVRARVPGYFFTSFLGGYAKGFDPYVRPKAADDGYTVRYPLVTCERRHLDKNGRKDIKVDIVHRPQGDAYFDLQARTFNPPDDRFVRETLVDALATLDVDAEIWDGDPFLRWQ